ncbi:LOC100492546 [Podarcis lilfordi]|uniref:LOC100492546 n=1 Tax=Podarcis lilfordi TaxID=74358 RepID=A0AA35KNQ9_9SAUR|nr:LOC100492546 [Podarcis lilfordi]
MLLKSAFDPQVNMSGLEMQVIEANKTSKKRKCVVNDLILKDFPFIRRGVKEHSAFCSLCEVTFTVGSGGRTSVVEHVATKRHKSSLIRESSNAKNVSAYFKTIVPDQSEINIALQEGTFAFHTVRHYHSFKSMDCTSSLVKKFMCSRTKVEAIVKHVIAPWAIAEAVEESNRASFVTILLDASNHCNTKLLPIIVRYVHVNAEKAVSICNKIVDFVQITGETAEIIYTASFQTIKHLGLEHKVVAVSADNTNTNFGGLKKKGSNNVLTKMKEGLGKNILCLGYNAQMIHNSAHSAINSIPVDVEGLVVKIFGYFHIFTVRVEHLEEFCEFVGQEHKNILSYSNVRWLSLLPAIRRICENYAVLKSFFLSEEKCPAVLKKWFSDPCTYLWMNFVASTLPLFHDSILQAEGEEVTAVEFCMILNILIQKLQARSDDKFIPFSVRKLLPSLEEGGSCTQEEFLTISRDFYTTAVEYLTAWSSHSEDIRCMECILLRTCPQRENFEECLQYFSSRVGGVGLSEDHLFDEISSLKEYVSKQKITKWNEDGADVCSRWSDIFSFFSQKMIPYPQLQKLVQLCLCLPGSNAAVERVFSSMDMMWTSQRSRLDIDTIKAVLAVQSNFAMDCQEFATKLESRRGLLSKVHSSEQYN